MNIKEMAPLSYLDGQWGTIGMFGMPDADADCPGSTTSNDTRMSKFREPFVVWKGPKSMAGGKKTIQNRISNAQVNWEAEKMIICFLSSGRSC